MMTQKALLFGDTEVAKKVLAVKGSGHKECTKVKAMGREVSPFDEAVWVRERGKSSLQCLVDGDIQGIDRTHSPRRHPT
jgi:predicted NAD-dependent protein-ADP-ribosyltransferase YbiA (DUF1768 family)